MILWCYFYLAYWQIGLSDTCVILLAAIIKVIVRLKSEKRVKKMAEHVDTCQVLRQGTWKELSTADLVPGDVIQVISNQTVPIDGVILQGDIVVDESSLTGKKEILFQTNKQKKILTFYIKVNHYLFENFHFEQMQLYLILNLQENQIVYLLVLQLNKH